MAKKCFSLRPPNPFFAKKNFLSSKKKNFFFSWTRKFYHIIITPSYISLLTIQISPCCASWLFNKKKHFRKENILWFRPKVKKCPDLIFYHFRWQAVHHHYNICWNFKSLKKLLKLIISMLFFPLSTFSPLFIIF